MHPLTPIATAHLFAPLHRELMRLLRGLADADWARPTVAGAWRVRDVVAHLLEVDLRYLYNALDANEARRHADVEGDAALATPLFAARSVMV